MNYKIGFIGAGKMATAITKGIIDSKICKRNYISVYDISDKALEKIKNDLKVSTKKSAEEVISSSDIVIFAVKPFVMRDVLSELKNKFKDGQLIVSIAAGISTKVIEEYTGKLPVIRVMPNTPAFVKSGMSAVCKGAYANEKDADTVCEIFNSLGKAIKEEEKNIDAVTAISGSGPAYFYCFINEFAKSGEKYGLKKDTALLLAAQTALGSAKMIMETGISPEELIRNVTTPGGCTEVGNNILEENNIGKIIEEVVKGTKNKAHELGK